MTDITMPIPPRTSDVSADLVAKRYRAERRFRAYGLISLGITALFLAFLVVDIVGKGFPAFFEHTMTLPVAVTVDKVDAADPAKGDFNTMVKDALKEAFPAMSSRADRKALLSLLSAGAGDDLRGRVVSDPSLIGNTVNVPLLMSADADLYFKGSQTGVVRSTGNEPIEIVKLDDKASINGKFDTASVGTIIRANNGAFQVKAVNGLSLDAEVLIEPTAIGQVPAGGWQQLRFSKVEADRRITDKEAVVLETLQERGLVSKGIAWRFFTSGDSREPELSGIKGALVGSLLTIVITLAISLPIGIAAAIYLEEFARKGRMTDFIEVNINNLAAVPSIIFGLLGLAVFLNFFGMPRSAPLVGGLVLALLVLPTIIIASRAAFRSVPPSLREAALGMGATSWQAVWNVTLPAAVPGIMTGSILAMSRAIGEAAPIMMISGVVFITRAPSNLMSVFTVLSLQIYDWAGRHDAGFHAISSAAIIVLLSLLLVFNSIAIVIRQKFSRPLS